MNQGIHGIFNYGDPETYRASNAISEAFEIPYYNWNNQVPFGVKSRNFELNVKPQTSEVIADIIGKNQWTNVDYLYDTDEGTQIRIP